MGKAVNADELEASRAVQPAVKQETDAGMAQHAQQAAVKSEQFERDSRGYADHQGQAGEGRWHPPPSIMHALHAGQPQHSNGHYMNGYTHADISSGLASSQQYFTGQHQDFTFSRQPQRHTQRLSPQPFSLSSADAEAQLFFMPQITSVPAGRAPKPNGIPHAASGPLSASHVSMSMQGLQSAHQQQQQLALLQQQQQQEQQQQEQQQQEQQQQQQQRDWRRRMLAQKRHQHNMQMQPQQQWHQQHMQRPPESQTPGCRDLQNAHKNHDRSMATSAQLAMHASSSPLAPTHGSQMNGWAGGTHPPAHAQHAQRSTDGHSNHQHSVSHHQRAQHGAEVSLQKQQSHGFEHEQTQHVEGLNGIATQSVQSGHATSGGSSGSSGTSTAFLIWVDQQYKVRGQMEKRAELRQFVQAARVSLFLLSHPEFG